jgi:hypothetical protein
MDFWDYNVKYLESIKPAEQTAAPKSAVKSDKWDGAKEDEIKDEKLTESEKSAETDAEETTDEQPEGKPAESESENNG